MSRWREAWRARMALVRLLGSAPRGRVVLLTVAVLVSGAVPAGLAISVGILVSRAAAATRDGFDSPAGRDLIAGLVIVGILVLVERLAPPFLDVLRTRVGRDIDGALRQRALAAADATFTIDELEQPETQDRIGLVTGGLFGTAGSAAVAGIGILGRYLQTISSLVVIAWFSVPIALVFLVVVIGIRRRWHLAFADLAKAMIETFGKMRRSSYAADLVLTPQGAKEARVFGLVDWLVGHQDRYWHEATAEAFRVRKGLRLRATTEVAALLACYLLVTVFSARAAAQREISLGVLAAVLQAQFWAAQLITPAPEDYATGAGIAATQAVAELEADGPRPQQPPTTSHKAPAPSSTIAFRGLAFTYPGATTPALRGFDLEVPVGRSLAIVGANGAGKTTLIKLLCGLHRPTEGSIVVDGIDLTEIDPRSWADRFAVVFQEFNRYDVTADENVRFGAVTATGSEAELASRRDRAAADVGAVDIVDGLPSGWDTILSRRYEGGADLSGGEWQRIALARALYALDCGATILVLDEPTAHLDVRAEAALFDHLIERTRGTTTILISHRFSTVRRADRIVVVDQGRVAEQGSHDELMAAGGTYAQMFDAQADAFRRG